jgi:hypothetical protein
LKYSPAQEAERQILILKKRSVEKQNVRNNYRYFIGFVVIGTVCRPGFSRKFSPFAFSSSIGRFRHQTLYRQTRGLESIFNLQVTGKIIRPAFAVSENLHAISVN